MSYRMIIFDLDGTLCDTLEDLMEACNYALKNCNLPEISLDQTRTFIGNGIKNLLLSASNQSSKIDILLKEFKKYYNEHYLIHTRGYPHIKELLSYYKSKGFILGVLTNKVETIARKIVEELFPSMFDFVYGEVEDRKRKPDPTFLLSIVQQWGLKKEEVIYIGDSEVDVKTSRNSGIFGIFVSYGFRKKEELLRLTDKLADSALDIIDLIGV